ncbi:MAG: MerR family transcriptional regulator [Myxococcales bacterium]|nr:MerR family transcriptional regulator [Myxococcales bacterium]
MGNVHRLPLARPSDSAHGAHTPQASDVAPPGLTPAESVPPEELLQVGDLARETGKTVRAIHHYESVGLLTPHMRSKGRYRLYGPDAVARVRWIDKLHDLGMSLSEIQQILRLWEQAPSAPSAMGQLRAVYHQKLAEVSAQIARLTALEHELHGSLDYLDTCVECSPSELVASCSACTVHGPSETQPELVRGLHACSATSASA